MIDNKKKNYDNQLDLTPFISLLSVCICFLLVTVAWYQVGALSMKQVLGGDVSQSASKDNTRSLWISFGSQKNTLEIKIKKGKQEISRRVIQAGEEESIDSKKFTEYVTRVKKQMPDIDQAFILPTKQVIYEDLIKVMDNVRQAGIFNLGVSPI